MTISIGVTEMSVQHVSGIPRLSHAEAGRLAQTEYERVLALLESLGDEDWSQPTYCAKWDVRDMTAHLAGAVTGSASFAEFRRQNVQNPYLKEFADSVDGTNKLQLEERADKTPAELVAEFRQNGQTAVNNRNKLPWLVRKVHMPMGSLGFALVEYLMDTIYPRDQWMHRYDICAATGKEMVITREHDGRIVSLVIRDLARKLQKQMQSRTIDLILYGEAGAIYRFGRDTQSSASLEMDFFDFNLLASGRIKVTEVVNRTAVNGDQSAANWFLNQIAVPY